MIRPAVRRLYPVALLLASGLASAAEPAEQRLTVTVSPPEVKIRPLRPGRGFIRLPDLEYLFLFEADCAGNGRPDAISLSIADSRLRIDKTALEGDNRTVEAALTVPARQIAPLPVAGFCELPGDAAAAATLPGRRRVAAALSAQASLSCRNDSDTRMVWVAEPLDVTLVCELPLAGEETG